MHVSRCICLSLCRIASVCTSLGLHSAAATHSNEGTPTLNPEDLAQYVVVSRPYTSPTREDAPGRCMQ